VRADSGGRTLTSAALLLLCTLPSALLAQGLPSWIIAPAAQDSLARLWAESIAANREHVGCLGGVHEVADGEQPVLLGVPLGTDRRGAMVFQPSGAVSFQDRAGPPLALPYGSSLSVTQPESQEIRTLTVAAGTGAMQTLKWDPTP